MAQAQTSESIASLKVSLQSFHGCTLYQVHGRKISLRFLGLILRVLRLEVSVDNVYITNQFQTNLLQGGGGGE